MITFSSKKFDGAYSEFVLILISVILGNSHF